MLIFNFITRLKFESSKIEAVLSLCSTCGLAEELEEESEGKKPQSNMPKSACGSVSTLLSPSSLLRTGGQTLTRASRVAVLPRRCFPLRQLSVSGDAGLQTRGEDCAGQHDAGGRVNCSRYADRDWIENLNIPPVASCLSQWHHCGCDWLVAAFAEQSSPVRFQSSVN